MTESTTQRPAAPKWETAARERLTKAVRRYMRPLSDLRDRDANEGDTRLLVTDFLCDGLGYDKYENLTTEYQVKGEFADYGVRVDRQLVAFIEVKRVSQKLSERHLRQVQQYAVNEGVEWMVLTNGQVWQVYHLTGGLPVVVDKVFEVDLLDDSSVAAKADLLFYLTLEAIKRGRIEVLWRKQDAVAPARLASLLVSDEMIDQLRKAVRRDSGHNPDAEVLRDAMLNDVIRTSALPIPTR